ncbi:hypothetical protein FHX64_002794 [Microbacter margulisiae]|uniref:Uncharacterized protein n=1 Tax=Microbacter margulisiae TaxID=1350067 RepID=A0A7W5DTG6_9PORP|nr:hypothetical protein [Microbacter margulisiae]
MSELRSCIYSMLQKCNNSMDNSCGFSISVLSPMQETLVLPSVTQINHHPFPPSAISTSFHIKGLFVIFEQRWKID